MKPIIGIITRNGVSSNGNNTKVIYSDIVSSIIKSGGVPIGIFNDNINDYYNICSGFIFQGGDLIEEENFDILKKLYENDKPVLAICLGMQEMAISFNGKVIDICNTVINREHGIKIDINSLLYKIIGSDYIIVNSRHKSIVSNTNLSVSAINNNEIEAIEDDKKRFFIGVQWHPENLYDTSVCAKKIFDYFVKVCDE